MRTGPWRAALPLACAALVAGCGSSSSGVKAPTIGAARTFKLAGFQPTSEVKPSAPSKVAFTIEEPSGKPLTRYKTGSGPHTGVHLIIVRDDLSTIIHKHPPVATNGRIAQALSFAQPGPYKVLVDAYPNLSTNQPNFQLFGKVRVAGRYKAQPLPPFSRTVDVGGYRFTMQSTPHLKALQASFLTITVTDPQGRKADFTPWYGALAHAIFFRSGTLDYFHTHVCGAGATNCTSVLGGARVTGRSSTPGKLKVGVLLPVKGTWRLFLQCKVQGRILTAPYTLKVS
ncbi:MAG: hypothetical protein ACJ766_00125 [Thermoleophilaceae bacterium]